jgi:hypothetical protein
MAILVTGPTPIDLDIFTDGVNQKFSVDLANAPFRWSGGLPVGTNPAFNLRDFRILSGTVANVTISGTVFTPTVSFIGTIATIDFGAVPAQNGATLVISLSFDHRS